MPGTVLGPEEGEKGQVTGEQTWSVLSLGEELSKRKQRPLRGHGPRSCSLSGVGGEQRERLLCQGDKPGFELLPAGCLPFDPGIPDLPASVSPSAQYDYCCSELIEP